MSVNLGPIAPGSAAFQAPANPQSDGLGHNPSKSFYLLFLTNFDVSHNRYLSQLIQVRVQCNALSYRKPFLWDKQTTPASQLTDLPRMPATGYQQIQCRTHCCKLYGSTHNQQQ